MEETPYPVPPLPANHLSGFIMPMPDSQPATETKPAPETQQATETEPAPETQPAPENADCSSRSSDAGSKKHLRYKSRLNKLAKSMKLPPPVYQTKNEGSNRLPRLRSIVCVDGESYTSSSVFRALTMAEKDASKLAYIAITQKAKTEALHFIQEDKISCKSIMAEFAAKKLIKKPVYKTTQLESSVPVFRSSMFFNGVTYPGDNGETKNEAEQLVARSVIIKYLDSEDGLFMAITVYCKLRQCHEMNKVQEINSVKNGSVLGAQTGVGHDVALTESGDNNMVKSSTTPELSLVQGTVVQATAPSSDVPQPIIPKLSVEPTTPVGPIIIQPHTQQISNEPINLPVPHATQSPTSRSAEPQALMTSVPSDVVNKSCTPVVSAASDEIPAVNLSSNLIQGSKPEASTTPQASVKPQAVAEPLVLTPVPSTVVNNSCSSVVSAPLIETPATNNSSKVIQQPIPEASSDQALEYIPLVPHTSDKKRKRSGKKNSQKKMHADSQISVVPASQVL